MSAQRTTPPSPGVPPVHTASTGGAPPVPHAVADTGFVTRQELLELAQRVQQLSKIQLQVLTQLSQLLAVQSDSTATLPNDEVVR